MKKHRHPKPADADLDKLLSRLDKLIALAEELRTDVTALKEAKNTPAKQAKNAPAVTEPQGAVNVTVAPVSGGSQYGFIVPKNLAATFNDASPIIEGKALPNYILAKPKPDELMDFRTVLAGLALPQAANNRKNLFPRDLMEHLPDDIRWTQVPDEREALSVVMGRSAKGFDLVILHAVKGNGEPTYLYVLEDKTRQKMIVAGPEPIGPKLEAALAKNGVTYVTQGEPAAAKTINHFVDEGALHRGDRGRLDGWQMETTRNNLVKAFSAICELPMSPPSVRRGAVTLGEVISINKSHPAVFTSMLKPKA